MAFTKVPIFHYFDSKSYIYIKTYTFGYAIGEIFSQLTLDQNFSSHKISKNTKFSKSDQWHFVVFFFRKISSIET